jgi:hypothetical protein
LSSGTCFFTRFTLHEADVRERNETSKEGALDGQVKRKAGRLKLPGERSP